MEIINYFYKNKIIFGHEEVFKSLYTHFLNKNIFHTLLFVGNPGIGKSILAKCLASVILDFNKLKLYDFKEIVHKDLLILEPEKNNSNKSGLIKLEQIRSMKSFYNQSSAEGGWRIAIVNDLDNVNLSNMNSLLKIIEEPPHKSLIILISSNYWQLPLTIKSRCNLVRFNKLDDLKTEEIILKNINPTNDDLDIKNCVNLSNGSPGIGIDIINNNFLELFMRTCLILSDKSERLELIKISEEWSKKMNESLSSRFVVQHLFENLIKSSIDQTLFGNAYKPSSFSQINFVEQCSNFISNKNNPLELSSIYGDFTKNFYDGKNLYLDFAEIIYRFFLKLSKT